MSMFSPATLTQAYLKAGIMGFAGDGKTYTMTQIAIGLINELRRRGLPEGNNPVLFLDSETGSDWVAPRFAEAGIQLHTLKTRQFTQLVPACCEASESRSILLIDSITHFWIDICTSYAAAKNRKRGLEFQDWNWLKERWREFTDMFVNGPFHCIMCGRAGYEWDFFENDAGKREIVKSGIKMKAESETGFEPSLLVLMERDMDLESKEVFRWGHVLKDRSTLIDGKHFKNPTYDDFAPHINFLSLGGKQLGFQAGNSQAIIPPPERMSDDWRLQREILLEKLANLFTRHGLTAQSKDGKVRILTMLREAFGTDSWKELETMNLPALKEGFDVVHLSLEGIAYFRVGAPAAGGDVVGVREQGQGDPGTPPDVDPQRVPEQPQGGNADEAGGSSAGSQ